MKTHWLKKENNKNLILFFNGWGMDENVISHLESTKKDILVVYDYNELKFDENLSNYASIALIAWSLGVFAASQVYNKIPNIKYSIAINGTPKAIDPNYGINPKIYHLTLNNMSSTQTRDKFFSKMFDDPDKHNKLPKPKREILNQKSELGKILQHYNLNKKTEVNFNTAIISLKDKIIPPNNQLNFWQTNNIKVVKLDSGHYPFFNFKSWEEIINATL